jgi:hypothetical protein
MTPLAATSISIDGHKENYGRDGNLSPAMGARNQVGIGLSYRPASLCSLATPFQTRFLESIPRAIAGLRFPTQESISSAYVPWKAGTTTLFDVPTRQAT